MGEAWATVMHFREGPLEAIARAKNESYGHRWWAWEVVFPEDISAPSGKESTSKIRFDSPS